jgi:hypothetical protein
MEGLLRKSCLIDQAEKPQDYLMTTSGYHAKHETNRRRQLCQQ